MKIKLHATLACGLLGATAAGVFYADMSGAEPSAMRRQMLGHVEKLLIVDSISVDKDYFLSAYRLMPSAGNVLDGDAVLKQLGSTEFPDLFVGDPLTGFTNEFKDYLIWSQRDTTGYYRLAESVKLIDGSWSTPRFASLVLNEGRETDDDDVATANAMYPFMSDDGQILYYASDNANSIGGLDIFIATKDPSDGSFLIPANIGLPYNSVADDYLLAIDPASGLGWWATDRNRNEGETTLFIYGLSDTRENVDPDNVEIENYASLLNWQTLQDEEMAHKADSLKMVMADIKKPVSRQPEFELPMPGGKTYRFFSDFKNKNAASNMMLFLEEKASLEKKQKQLEALRKEYHSGNKKVASNIEILENELRVARSNLQVLKSEIYKAEGTR